VPADHAPYQHQPPPPPKAAAKFIRKKKAFPPHSGVTQRKRVRSARFIRATDLKKKREKKKREKKETRQPLSCPAKSKGKKEVPPPHLEERKKWVIIATPLQLPGEKRRGGAGHLSIPLRRGERKKERFRRKAVLCNSEPLNLSSEGGKREKAHLLLPSEKKAAFFDNFPSQSGGEKRKGNLVCKGEKKDGEYAFNT